MSGYLHLLWQSLGPSRLLQMALLHSFYDWAIFHCVQLYHMFFIHSSVNGYLSCLWVLTIVNSAAVNIRVHVWYWTRVFSKYVPRMGLQGPLKSWLIGKDSDSGRDWGQEEKGTTEDEMAGGITDWMDVSLSELRELGMDREAWPAVIHGVTKSRTRLSNWTELKVVWYLFLVF